MNPPDTVENYDFSYAASLARSTGQSKFRWRLNGDEWLCDEIAGVCDIDSVSQKGHITVRGQLVLSEERGKTIAYLYPPEEDAEAEVDGQQLPNSHWRLCANLAGADDDKWRLRNERTNDVMHIRGYQGRAQLNWLDGGPHVFHEGAIVLDDNKIAHLR